MKKFKEILSLFCAFFKIGLFTFGGGYAMIAVISREIVERKKWISEEDYLNVIAIAESTPGPIAINTATYLGYKRSGFWGSLFATLGVTLPSFIIIFAISLFFDKFMQFKCVQYAFKGIQACVAFLILSAGIKMFKSLKKTPFNLILCILTFLIMTVFNVFSFVFSSVYYILIGGVIGVIFFYLSTLIKNKRKDGEK